jgi:hypothetical protein
VDLSAGQGLQAQGRGGPEQPLELPAGALELFPGSDPLYYMPGERIELRWKPSAERQHLQVLGVDSDVVLINRDVGPPPFVLEIPWPGTFRWRVALRDAGGFESLPSVEGLVCVLEK